MTSITLVNALEHQCAAMAANGKRIDTRPPATTLGNPEAADERAETTTLQQWTGLLCCSSWAIAHRAAMQDALQTLTRIDATSRPRRLTRQCAAGSNASPA